MIITFTLLLCCCCWQYYLQQQKKRKQSFEKNNFNNNSCNDTLFNKKKFNKHYNHFNLSFIQQFFNLTLSKATTSTTASNLSSYCNDILTHDTYSCVPLYSSCANKAISFAESLTNDKANLNLHNLGADSNTLLHCYSESPTTNLPTKLSSCKINYCSNLPNIYNKRIIGNENEYYSCIQTDLRSPKQMVLKIKSETNLNYCALKKKTVGKSHYQTYNKDNLCKSKILTSYDSNTIAYPPYLLHLQKKKNLNNKNYSDINNKLDKKISYSKQKSYLKKNSEFNTTVDSGCYVLPSISDLSTINDKLNDHNLTTKSCRLPSFIVPPSPSTIPPPPVNYITNMHQNNEFIKI